MNVLIVKLGATGDVVRTTPLLRRFSGPVSWVTAATNKVLLDGVSPSLRTVSWEDRSRINDATYDLVINLEDEPNVAAFVKELRYKQLFGAYLDPQEQVRYTDDARAWFDLSLISVHGKEKADQLKLQNRRTYQDMIFEGLGFSFAGDAYLMPPGKATDLAGDVAIAPVAGPVWPMKNWAYYDQLQQQLGKIGLKVNVLPRRQSLLEHLGDVQSHRCFVGGDSLPMHLALGGGTACVSIFNCTSPWEIHDYGVQTKLVSPLLHEFFYKRGFDPRATTAISLTEVLDATLSQLKKNPSTPEP